MRKIFTTIVIISLAFISSKGQGLCINEIDYDQPGSDSAEFIELYNRGVVPEFLGNYTVILYNGSATTPGIYDSIPLPAQTLQPGDYFVICNGGGLVPNCDMVHGAASNMIQNGAPDAVALRNNNDLTVFGAVSYEGNSNPPYVEGNGVPLAQSDTGSTPYVGISRFPDGTVTGDDSTDFNRACITPGHANVDSSTGCQSPIYVQNMIVENGIALYPNPTAGLVNISSINPAFNACYVTIVNLLGNEVKSYHFTDLNKNEKAIDLTTLNNGIYLIHFRSEKTVYTQRLIVND